MRKSIFFIFAISMLFSCNGAQPSSSVKDIDGNVYKTKKIGKQIWMVENLRVTHYRNGDPIPNQIEDEDWDQGKGAYCDYDNDPANAEIYGRIYNWFAATDSRGLAPEGWHVPTDAEWQELINFLGGDSVAGGKMKSLGTVAGGDGLWLESNIGATNESGFTALPGGYRYNHGVFDGLGYNAYFWSATESSGGTAWHRYLYTGNSTIYRDQSGWKQGGYSIRCVKD